MRNRKRMFLFCSLFFALLTAGSAAMATTLTVKILDESGFPATARVYLTDKKGESYFPSGTLVYKKMNWNVLEEHFLASGGSFSIELPKNAYSLRIERGKEYLPIQDDIELPDSGKVETPLSGISLRADGGASPRAGRTCRFGKSDVGGIASDRWARRDRLCGIGEQPLLALQLLYRAVGGSGLTTLRRSMRRPAKVLRALALISTMRCSISECP